MKEGLSVILQMKDFPSNAKLLAVRPCCVGIHAGELVENVVRDVYISHVLRIVAGL